MHISSPFVVVGVILIAFVVSILYATSSKEDKPSSALRPDYFVAPVYEAAEKGRIRGQIVRNAPRG